MCTIFDSNSKSESTVVLTCLFFFRYIVIFHTLSGEQGQL